MNMHPLYQNCRVGLVFPHNCSVVFKKFHTLRYKFHPILFTLYGHNLAEIACKIGKLIIFKQNYAEINVN